MDTEISKLSADEIDVRISTVQKKLTEIQESSDILKTAQDVEELEKTLQKYTRELADLIAAKKNPKFIKK